MKKSAIAAAVIIALGAVWSGAAWYAGKTAEAQYQDQINRINQKLQEKSAEGDLQGQIENVDFSRGVFSSDVRYDAVITNASDNARYVVPFVGKLYHGPLTLNNFSFALFSADMSIEKNAQTQNWFKDDKSNPLNAVITMDYNQRLKGDFRSDLTHQTEHNKFEWTLNGRFEADEKGYGKAEIAVPTAMLRELPTNTSESAVKNNEVLLNNAKVSWDIMPSGEFQHLVNGRTHFIADSLTFKGEDDKGKVQNEIKKMDLTLSQKEEQGFADIAVAYGFGDWIHQGVSFGNGNLALQFNHLNAKALNALVEDLRKNGEKDWLKAGDGALGIMLNDSPQIKLSALDLTNTQGNLHADLAIAPVKDAEQKALQQKQLLGLFNELALNIQLDKTALQAFFTAFEQASQAELTREEAEKEAKLQMDRFLQQIQQANIFKEDDKNLTLRLFIENNLLKFNDLTLSEQEVQMALFAAMMMYGR